MRVILRAQEDNKHTHGETNMKRLELEVGTHYRIYEGDNQIVTQLVRITVSQSGAVMVFFDIDETPVTNEELGTLFANGKIEKCA
jgi:hypothetical protein